MGTKRNSCPPFSVYRVRGRPETDLCFAWRTAARVEFYVPMRKKMGLRPENSRSGFRGGTLTLCRISSETPADGGGRTRMKIPCHVNYAIPVYSRIRARRRAKVQYRERKSRLPRRWFEFRHKTCPMCLLHGDQRHLLPMGSVTVYHELRKRGISCELHIFSRRSRFHVWNDATNTNPCATWITNGSSNNFGQMRICRLGFTRDSPSEISLPVIRFDRWGTTF